MQIYFDNAATTRIDERVIELMVSIMKDNYGNPSSIHSFGRKSKVIIENARKKVASLLHVVPSEIFFTSGGTEAISTIINGAVSIGINHFISGKLEHSAVLKTLYHLENEGKIQLDFVPFDEKGHLDLNVLATLLKQDKRSMVCLMHAQNELGNLLPLKKVGELCHENMALFCCDTVQTMGKFPIDFSDTYVDFAVCSAHKFHGPKGVGFMYINSTNSINPQIFGGGQERNMRSGTENIYGIAGLAKAFEIANEELQQNMNKIAALKLHLMDRLKAELPDVVINGDEKGLYTILNLGFPKPKFGQELLMKLDIDGVAVSGGSACSSGSLKDSAVITELGLVEKIQAVRISFSKYNTLQEVDALVDLLKTY